MITKTLLYSFAPKQKLFLCLISFFCQFIWSITWNGILFDLKNYKTNLIILWDCISFSLCLLNNNQRRNPLFYIKVCSFLSINQQPLLYLMLYYYWSSVKLLYCWVAIITLNKYQMRQNKKSLSTPFSFFFFKKI